MRFYRHAQTKLAEFHAVRKAIDQLSAKPHGPLQVSMLIPPAQHALLKLLPELLTKYPKMRRPLNISNQRMHLINAGYDVA